MRTISKKGADFIASFEKEVLHVYDDGFGYLTGGIGHVLTPAELQKYPKGSAIPKEQSQAWWMADLKKYSDAVNAAVTVQLVTQNMFDAMCSLCFNIGIAGFDHSSVLTFTNEGRLQEAAKAFGRWNKSRGQVVKGLVVRRAAEAKMYLTPDSAADTGSSAHAPSGEAGTPSTGDDSTAAVHLEGQG